MKLSSSSIVAILIILFNSVTSFAPGTRSNGIHVIDIDFHSRSTLLILHESNDKDNKVKNPFVKASWFAVESFGQIFGTGGKKSKTNYAGTKVEIDLTRAPSNLNEALKRIELDNERSYFLSGQVDVCAYDEDCIFADPFVSFAGRQRFVDNLANLGSFITKYDAKFLGYDVINGGTQVQTKVMVKLELNLPWKPVLAWPWGVKYIINSENFLITEHIESWDIEPFEGVKQIFRKPTVSIKN